MDEPYLGNQGKLPGGDSILLAYELYQNGTIQTGFLIHKMTSVCLKGGTLPGTGGLMESRQVVQQEIGLLIVGTKPPMGSSGNLTGTVTPQSLPGASLLRLDSDVYLFPPGFPFGLVKCCCE